MKKKSMNVTEEGAYPPNDFDDKPAFRSAMPIKVRNNAQNPIVDITTTLPKYHAPGRTPSMRSVGLEGSHMPRRAVPNDKDMFKGMGRIAHDHDVHRPVRVASDAELFGHMKRDARGELRQPQGPRVGRPRRN